MKIAMIGSGYVGLVSGACFADFGHDVVCIDKDASKIERLNANIMPIYEPGLAALVKANVDAGRLRFSTDLASSVEGCAAVFILANSIAGLLGNFAAVRSLPPELPIYQRMSDEAECKKRIGLAAAQLIQDGETVFLGSGTTVSEVARSLRNSDNLTVITNSLLVLNQLIEKPRITAVALGGILRLSELSLIGGTGKLVTMKGVVRSNGISDGAKNFNETKSEIEYWFAK